ncbi:MAG: hypothetical protein CM15mP62_04390 [Rhodospirillaceae bacterium]|nr:MAG: hypothetical protein CM15mP62_04390 [Rhodospirillaceae bacterium]
MDGGISLSTVALNHPQGAVGYRVNFGEDQYATSPILSTKRKIDQNIKSLVSGSDLVIYEHVLLMKIILILLVGVIPHGKRVKLCKAASVKSSYFSP